MLLFKFVMLRYTLPGLISAKFQAAVSKGDTSDSSGMHQVNLSTFIFLVYHLLFCVTLMVGMKAVVT